MNYTSNSSFAETVRTILREELAALTGDQTPDEPGGAQYLTTDDVVRRLRIGKTTLWQLRRDGAIRGFNVGRRVLFRPEDVEALVEGVRA